MKKTMFSILATLVAIIFWVVDSSVHYYVYGEEVFELFPSDINELWMRTIIVALIVLAGFFGDYHVRKLLAKQQKLEAMNVYQSTCFAADHILTNLLEQLELVKIEALRSNDFDREVIKFFDAAVDDASTLIEKLSNVKEVTSDNIKMCVH